MFSGDNREHLRKSFSRCQFKKKKRVKMIKSFEIGPSQNIFPVLEETEMTPLNLHHGLTVTRLKTSQKRPPRFQFV